MRYTFSVTKKCCLVHHSKLDFLAHVIPVAYDPQSKQINDK